MSKRYDMILTLNGGYSEYCTVGAFEARRLLCTEMADGSRWILDDLQFEVYDETYYDESEKEAAYAEIESAI